MAADSVRWGNTRIPFQYEYAERRTLAISVHPDLRVTVKAPTGTPIEVVRERVSRRGPWIRRAWHDFRLYQPKQPARQYVNGETHRYLGRQYRLKAVQGKVESVKCLRGYLWVTIWEEPTPAKAKKLLEAWYRDHARKVFSERLELCYKKAVREGVPHPTLTIRKMTTRWGSCSNSNRITLNLELIKATKDCIDYVIMHELCHLVEKHHGPGFRRLLAKLMPDYKERKKKLNMYADV